MALELVASPTTLYRVGRLHDPFVWRLPLFALKEAVHPHDGYRWDDPAADFATLYFGSSPLACFVETLAYYRPDAAFIGRLRALTSDDEPDEKYDFELGSGRVPESYFSRALGQARIAGESMFVDVDHPRTHAQLTEDLHELLAAHGRREFDRGVMMTQDRTITRAVAGHLQMLASAGQTHICGIRYESRVHAGLECWAAWEHCSEQLVDREVNPLTPHTPDLRDAAQLLGLQL
ncbi:MAG: RES domain-containing protein [Pseudonocardiaceae bacterium]